MVRTSNSEDHTYGKGARHSCYSHYTGCGSHECQGRSCGVDQRWRWLRSRDGGRFSTVRASRSGEVVLYSEQILIYFTLAIRCIYVGYLRWMSYWLPRPSFPHCHTLSTESAQLIRKDQVGSFDVQSCELR